MLTVMMILSCEKEPRLIIENTGVSLLNGIKMDNQSYYEYVYNEANLIVEEKGIYDLTIHHYNTNNQLVSTDYYVNYNLLSSDPSTTAAAINQKVLLSPSDQNKACTINFEYSSAEQLV